MAKIEKATAEMFEDICLFLVDGDTGPAAEEQIDRLYRPIFHYAWQREENHYGHALVHHGKIVGFVGSFFVQRSINGKTYKFANLTTWKVKEEHRSESIFLLMQFLRNKEYTVTGRTASREIFAIQQKLGFRCLDDKAYLTPTWLGVTGCRNVDIVPLEAASGTLCEEEFTLLQDHLPYPCKFLVITRGSAHLFLIFTLPKKRHCPVACIHYMNDSRLFLELLPAVRRHLLRKYRIPLLWVESRFLRGRSVPCSWLRTSQYVHLFRSEQLPPEDIDNLYTELTVYRTLENRFYW